MVSIDCSGLDKGAVLAHLYNHSVPLRMGFFQSKAQAMTVKEANQLLAKQNDIDYCFGRPLKINFASWPVLNPWSYDRDNGGEGTMERLIKQLRDTGVVSDDVKFIQPSRQELMAAMKGETLLNNMTFNNDSDDEQTDNNDAKCLSDFPDIQPFHTVRFTVSFCQQLEKMSIPYPYEWHMYGGKTMNGDYKFTGSMGGKFSVKPDQQCVESVGHEMGI